MMAAKVALVRCRSCAFENQRDAPGCFICGQSLAGAEPVVARERPGGVVRHSARAAVDAGHPPFRLTSGILLVALIGVLWGVMQIAPGLAVALAIPATIAMLWTSGGSGDRGSSPFDHRGLGASGFRSSLWFDDMPVVVWTFLALMVMVIVAIGAFFVTCLVATGGRTHFGG